LLCSGQTGIWRKQIFVLVAYLWYVASTKSFSDLQTTLYTLYLMLFKVENVSAIFTLFPGPGILAEEIPYF
jgi:hypothetical protein